jgi:predicted Zn-ribbon and HTH transcriptional regulator
MSDDPEYDDLQKAERKAAKVRKQTHYHLITLPPCCKNCKNITVHDPYEHDDNGCKYSDSERWYVGAVSLYGICDNYEEKPHAAE